MGDVGSVALFLRNVVSFHLPTSVLTPLFDRHGIFGVQNPSQRVSVA